MKIILSESDKQELEEFIAACIKSQLSIINQTNSPGPDAILMLSRKETAEFLKVSLVTLGDYTDRGILKPYRIGRRVLYEKNELMSVLKSSRKGVISEP
jgi:hypothetical protein